LQKYGFPAITQTLDAAPAALDPPIAGTYKQMGYLAADGHVHELFCSLFAGWGQADITAITRAPAAAPGSPLTSYVWETYKQIGYLTADGHVHELFCSPATGWGQADITAVTGAPAAAPGSPLTSYVWETYKQIGYLTADGHVHELFCSLAAGWGQADITVITGAPAVAPGSPLISYVWTTSGAPTVVLSGSNNVVLVDNCKSLSNLTVQLQVTEDLVTLEDLGFSLQLNSYPQIGAITPNSTPGTTFPGDVVGQLWWFQYLLIVAGNRISFEIQYWANAKSFQTGGPGGIPPEIRWPAGYTPDPPDTSPWLPVFPKVSIGGDVVGFTSSNKVPAGSVLTIQLATDSSANVTGATFSITDPGGNVQSASTHPWQHYAGQTEPSNYALFPIYGFQADLVSAPNLACTFTSGAGTLTYSVSPGILSVQTGNTCGGAQPGTAENSNVVYQEGVWPASGSTVRQSFVVSPQG
jgi:hypothetical protein